MKEDKSMLYLIFCVAGLCFFLGTCFGSFWMKQECNSNLELLSDTYQEIIFKVTDLDAEKIMQSYEYCESVMEDKEIQELLNQSKGGRPE